MKLDYSSPEVRTAFPAGARLFDILSAALGIVSGQSFLEKVNGALDASGLTGSDLMAAKIAAANMVRYTSGDDLANEILSGVAYKSWPELGVPSMPAGSEPATLTWELRIGLLHLILGCARAVILSSAESLLLVLTSDQVSRDAIKADLSALSESFGIPPTREEAQNFTTPA